MSQFKVRFAKKYDKETVLKFCQNTWIDLNDYIHLVWDKCLEDDRSKIFVVTNSADIPIAIKRVVLLSENESWWEGFRLDPNYRQQFLAIISLVEKHITKYLIENNINISPSCVLVNNKVMNVFTVKRRKCKISEKYIFCNTETLPSPTKELSELKLKDLDSILSLIQKYNPKETKPIHISRGAKWQELTEKRIKKLITDRQIWGIKNKDKLLSIATKTYPEASINYFWVGYISGDQESLSTLLFEIRKIANHLKCSTVGGYFSCQENLIQSLDRAGFKIIENQDVYVYQWENK